MEMNFVPIHRGTIFNYRSFLCTAVCTLYNLYIVLIHIFISKVQFYNILVLINPCTDKNSLILQFETMISYHC